MLLSLLKKKGVSLPKVETINGLSAKDIMDKIRSFYFRLEQSHSQTIEEAPDYFLELLYHYPKSVCSRKLSDTLKLLIALYYLESKPEYQEYKSNDPWPGYSYEDLALIFDRSKATIHGAIKQKETEAKRLLEEAKLRAKAKQIALEQLVREEKMRLLKENLKGSKKQANEHLHTYVYVDNKAELNSRSVRFSFKENGK